MSRPYIILLISLFFTSSVLAQEQNNKFFVEIPSLNKEAFFDKTLSLLLSSDYFVISADKGSGLIQCKIVVDNKRIISAKRGDILDYNLWIQSTADNLTKIYLQANQTEKNLTGRGGSTEYQYHNDDKGVTLDPKHYEVLINFLKTHLVNNQRQNSNTTNVSQKDTVLLATSPFVFRTGTLPDNITLKMANTLQDTITTGLYYHIESNTNGWKKISPDNVVEDLGYAIPPNGFETFDVSLLKNKIRYKAGRYRIVKRYLKSDYRKTKKSFDVYAEIVVE